MTDYVRTFTCLFNYQFVEIEKVHIKIIKVITQTSSLVTYEDDEESYMPRPSWAKAMDLDASSRKRQQLSSECEALKDLQEEALYISRSSISDLYKIGEGVYTFGSEAGLVIAIGY